MKIMKMIALFSMLLLLAACADRPEHSRPQAWLKPGVQVSLPPAGISPAINQQQLLTATVKGQQHTLLVLLDADHARLTLAGLSSLGIRLFRVTYDQQGIHTEQSINLPELPPAQQVLADIMLSYWPLVAWQTQLPRGWTLIDQSSERRELRDNNGNLVTAIRYQLRHGQRQPISVHQYAFGYEITIQTLDS